MSEWKPYPRNRKVAENENYLIIVPNTFNDSKAMQLFCDICQIRFGNTADDATYREFGCCSSCADAWAYSHREEWKNGWRPSVEQVETVRSKRLFANSDITFE